MPVEPIEAPYYPIIYVRGFAMRVRDVQSTVATPFMGFNDGATKLRQRPAGPVTPFVFESPLVRLMKEFGYRDVYQDGEQLGRRVQPRSIVIYRYYDEEDPDIGKKVSLGTRVKRAVVGDLFGDPAKMLRWTENLRGLIYQLRNSVCGDDDEQLKAFRVHLVAHSMGGLICRCLLQNADLGNSTTIPLIDKVFTYATPHNGVDLLNLNIASAYFRRPDMKRYLSIAGDAVNSLEGKFDEKRFFCLVGTNARDYDEVHGASRRAAGPMSDGLVLMENAYVKGAYRNDVHRSHSGAFGIVNSEEGYQNLWRFLFGDVVLEGRLVIDGLPPDEPGGMSRSYYVDCTVAPKGAYGYKLTRRRRDDWSAIHRTREQLDSPKAVDRTCALFSLFVARADPGGEKAVFAVDLAVSESVAEQEGVPVVEDYLPDQYLFRQAITLTVGSQAKGLAYSFESQAYETKIGDAAPFALENPDGTENVGDEQYVIHLTAINGFMGRLFVTIRRGDRDPFDELQVAQGRDADGRGTAEREA